MRLATYNVEWFSSLFSRDNRLLADAHWSGRHGITRQQQARALQRVFQALDADAALIVEAPNSGRKQSSVIALENFARDFGLRTRRALTGFFSETQQEITLMFDPDVIAARHEPVGLPRDTSAPRFDSTFRVDPPIDQMPETITFSKPPLEAALTTRSGYHLRLIGVHAKSKAPHGARNAGDLARISIANRHKQMAQCVWIRRRADAHLAAGDSLIVLGDFNDGPGLDEYEHLFGRSGVEIVLGADGPADRMLFDPNAALAMSPRNRPRPATARFFLPDQGGYLNALLDYIMVSPDLRKRAGNWEIWHPFDHATCCRDADLRDALLSASDHFPVTVELDI